METATIRTALIEYVEGQAGWRRRKAADFPDDEGNPAAAARLDELVAYIRALPDDDPGLVALSALPRAENIFVPGEFFTAPMPGDGEPSQFDRELSQYGFHSQGLDCAAFYAHMCQRLAEDATAFDAWMTLSEEGALHPEDCE